MIQEQATFTVDTVKVTTVDDYQLSALVYTPFTTWKAKIIIACATGVPQMFYRRFAEYSTQQGFQVVSFDYRGVGLSAPSSLKNFKMSYLDWGRLDLAAVIDYTSSFDSTEMPIFLIAHSVGGQAFGLTHNHSKIKAMLCFGTGAGWSGYMPIKEKLKVEIMWKVIFPPLVATYGYLPWSKLNMGSDLPLGVYKEWKRWCKNPTYYFSDPQHQNLIQQYAQIDSIIYAYSALDDDWALPQSRHAFMQHYRNAQLNYIDIHPSSYGLKHMGHMGYFKKGAEQLWNEILTKLDQLN